MTPRSFFTADLHLSHSNIIAFSNRPFGTAEERAHWNDELVPVSKERKAELTEEMDESIVATINKTVNPKDTLYILGDVSFARAERTAQLIKRIKCRKILIKGNHDPRSKEFDALFDEVHHLLEQDFLVDGKKVRIVMCHYALRVWNKSHHGSLHLYGHSHGTLPDNGTRSMDVGIDTNNMQLYTLDDIMAKIGTRPLKAFDHHGTKAPL